MSSAQEVVDVLREHGAGVKDHKHLPPVVTDLVLLQSDDYLELIYTLATNYNDKSKNGSFTVFIATYLYNLDSDDNEYYDDFLSFIYYVYPTELIPTHPARNFVMTLDHTLSELVELVSKSNDESDENMVLLVCSRYPPFICEKITYFMNNIVINYEEGENYFTTRTKL